MPSPSVELRLRVIYGDTDQMGVVYYANYFRFFEAARGEFLRVRGLSYRDMEKEGALLPVVEAHCHYRASARYDDLLAVRATVEEVKRASFAFVYEIRREGEEPLLATGKTVHACMNREGRPVRIPASMVEILGGLSKGSNP